MKSAYDKIAAGLKDAIRSVDPIDPTIADAMGEVVASMMRHDTLDHYRRERTVTQRNDPDYTGHYEGCLVEAEEMIRRLRARGFDVVKMGG